MYHAGVVLGSQVRQALGQTATTSRLGLGLTEIMNVPWPRQCLGSQGRPGPAFPERFNQSTSKSIRSQTQTTTTRKGCTIKSIMLAHACRMVLCDSLLPLPVDATNGVAALCAFASERCPCSLCSPWPRVKPTSTIHEQIQRLLRAANRGRTGEGHHAEA